MHLARSGISVAAGFAVFSVLFTLLGPSLGAVLTTLGAGLMGGYLTAKLAGWQEMAHAGATAGLVAASILAQPALNLPARAFVAALAVAAITAGGWVRGQARMHLPARAPEESPSAPPQSREAEGGSYR